MSTDRRTALMALSSALLSACGGDDITDSSASALDAGPDAAALGAESAPAFDANAVEQEYADAAASLEPVLDKPTAHALASQPGKGPDGAVITPTPVSQSGDPAQFLTWDGGSGPSRDFWSTHLQLPWKNKNSGDWRDSLGVAQGLVPYAVVTASTAGVFHSFPVTALVKRWIASGENRGALIRTTSVSAGNWTGREGAVAQSPVLVVRTSTGTYNCPCLALAGYSSTSANGINTRTIAKGSTLQPMIAQFDLKPVVGTVIEATIKLFCQTKNSTPVVMQVFEADPPRFQLGTGGIAVQMGIAAAFPGDRNLRTHPDVIRAGDFSNLNKGVVFDSAGANAADNPYEILDDPLAPGTKMFRGSFNPSASGSARSSFSAKVEALRANYADPLRPTAEVIDEMFCRLYIFLENDWNSTRDANKMAIGWDLRMGWWNDAQGGYWAPTTGNGGAPGSGLKVYAPAAKNGGSQRADRWEYQGHSVRMEAGKGVSDGNPYSHMRPLQTYAYNLDQPTAYGEMVRLGNGVIAKGRWHCIEQQIKLNSVVGPYDGNGNGIAVADGIIRTWLDGVLCSEVKNMRWRRHREMGVQGPWLNWFYGGKQPTEVTMHYRMNHFVCARKYIGPRVG